MTASSERTTAERITLAVSILILAGILGLLGWSSMRSGDAAPVIRVEAHLDRVRDTGSGYHVPITITNDGDITAQDVTVQGELDTGEGEPETAEVTITFLAGGETERGELVFTTDPNDGEFSVGPTSFMEP